MDTELQVLLAKAIAVLPEQMARAEEQRRATLYGLPDVYRVARMGVNWAAAQQATAVRRRTATLGAYTPTQGA